VKKSLQKRKLALIIGATIASYDEGKLPSLIGAVLPPSTGPEPNNKKGGKRKYPRR
jgi:hypothetical protein